MKIDSATIGMESARSYKTSSTTFRQFAITDYQAGLNTTVTEGQVKDEEESKEQVQTKNNTAFENWQDRFGISSSRISLRESVDNKIADIRQVTIRYIFDMLFAARRDKLYHWLDEEEQNSANLTEDVQSLTNTGDTGTTANFKVLSYSQEYYFEETENTYFSTVGTVRTADGREINFNVEVGMSRQFQEYYREEIGATAFQMCDPLVINLDGNVAGLSDQKFFFDIDGDGEKDEISELQQGSGYLALDANEDGVINDGKELFGTASGDGFGDLAKYDEDGNGWIDENDSVWSKLQIWCKGENGEDILYTLAEKGVGAICLQKASTDFTLQGSAGMTNGAIRSTGIFLYENGNVGTMQHVDVAKYSKEA